MLGHIVGRAECLRIRLDYNVAKTPFARLYSPLEVLFPVIVEFPKSLDSTLVDLMVNGYDLTSVQPFLEA